MTIATVSKQIHEEITEAVNQVIKNIAGSVNERMTKVHAGIMQEIISVTAHKTATDYERLGCPPFDQLLKDLTSDKKHDCHCPPETKPVVTPIPVSKPIIIPSPVHHTLARSPNLKVGSWIWSPEYKTNPKPAVGHTRAFRRTFLTPTPVNALTLKIAAADMYTVYVNGKLVGCGKDWKEPDTYTIRFEPTTRVVVAVIASQGRPGVEVGMIAAGKLWDSTEGNPIGSEFGTDATWLAFAADDVSEKFIEPSFVDDKWAAAHVITAHGAAPWRDITPATAGKAVGQRISGINNIRAAPNAPPAEEWKL